MFKKLLKEKNKVPPSTLAVRVIRGSNIKSISITGNVDPYVIVTTGHEYAWSKQQVKTRVVYKNKNPVWDQSFTFKVKDVRQDVVQLTLWDHNAVDSNKMIGAATYPVSSLPQGQEVIIQQLPFRRGKKIKGYIDIGLTAINFGTVTQVTTTVMSVVPPQQTTIVAQQPLLAQPIQTQQPLLAQPIQSVVSMPTQPMVMMQQQPQPTVLSYPHVSQSSPYIPVQETPVAINYDGVPLMDNNAYFAYSNMLYGDGSTNVTYSPDQVIQVTAPPMAVQTYPNM